MRGPFQHGLDDLLQGVTKGPLVVKTVYSRIKVVIIDCYGGTPDGECTRSDGNSYGYRWRDRRGPGGLTSGMALGQAGGAGFNLEIAAAGNTQVMRAKMQVMKNLNLPHKIEDILITLDKQYHLIRPLQFSGNGKLFLYLALNRDQANLAMARYRLEEIESSLQV